MEQNQSRIWTGEAAGVSLVAQRLSDKRVTVFCTENSGHKLLVCIPIYWDVEELAMHIQQLFERILCYTLQSGRSFTHAETIHWSGAQEVPLPVRADILLCMNPILLADLPAYSEYLAITPLREEELDWKRQKGQQAFFKRYQARGFSEKWDEYRESMLKRKFFI